MRYCANGVSRVWCRKGAEKMAPRVGNTGAKREAEALEEQS
ncbi:hypothetical protein DOT_5316 [Desulfosporosinus sp. OT]|nr:hypothetical protein DOT_5316 [Desulfosporosinus sp. OT]